MISLKSSKMEKRKSKNPIVNLFRYTWKYSFGAKRRVVFFIALSVIANAIYLIQPIIAGKIFNAIQFSSGDPNLLEKNFNIWECLSLSQLVFGHFMELRE